MIQRIALLHPLHTRPFRLLFSGQVISDLGDWLDYLAVISLIIYSWHLGPFALAAYPITMFLPVALVAPFAGIWVDRWPGRATMIVCDLIRAVLVLGLVWAPNIYVALLLVAASVVTGTFFSPARQVMMRSTVPEDELLAANSLTQLSTQAAKVIGPAIGGLILFLAGTRAAFVCDALSFLASAAILSRLPRVAVAAVTAPSQEKPHFWQEFRAGLTYISHRKMLITAICSMSAALFIVFTFDSLGALALQSLGFGSSLLGLAIGSIGLGTAIGAIIIGQWATRISPMKLMSAGEFIAGLMVALIGCSVILQIKTFPAAWILLWLVVGFAGAAMIVPYGYILQKETEPQFMGRVASTANGLQMTFLLLSPLVGATIARFFGVGIVFAFAGAILALLGGGMLLFFFRSDTSQSKTSSGIPQSQANVETEVS